MIKDAWNKVAGWMILVGVVLAGIVMLAVLNGCASQPRPPFDLGYPTDPKAGDDN